MISAQKSQLFKRICFKTMHRYKDIKKALNNLIPKYKQYKVLLYIFPLKWLSLLIYYQTPIDLNYYLPQEYILGPVLFILYIHNLNDHVKVNIIIQYADNNYS